MEQKKSSKLGQWSATAIAGNSILSTVLFVPGTVILFGGIYAPLIFLAIALLLYFYKAVFTEVVEALPINGGVYNCMLNGTSKTIASIAGVTTFLCYLATAVLSAITAIDYLHSLVSVPILLSTIGLIGLFALINIAGIKDSAKVALGIFVFHVLCLILFLVLGLMFYLKGNSHFIQNLSYMQEVFPMRGGTMNSLFLAFSAGLLLISGFESSANFVEEQGKGVFRKTLRNMLVSITIFGPLITVVLLNTMDYLAIARANDFLLADAALLLGGPVFKLMIAIDAILVLSGAVLTAYIGVSGLFSRMAADGCLPNIMNNQNKRGAFPLIIITFFILCSSILLLTEGNTLALAGVYTLSFLGVLILFALGNLLLKETRKELRRTYRAPVILVCLAFVGALFGIIGNIRIDSNYLLFFSLYFLPIFLLVLAVIYQDNVLKFLLHMTTEIPVFHDYLEEYLQGVMDRSFAVFIHNHEKIYKIMNYIETNEVGRKVTFVHCHCDEHKEEGLGARQIERLVRNLKEAGAFTDFDVDVISLETPFGPKAINEVTKQLKIKKNKVLIGSIHNFHPYDYSQLGGVRVIF